MVDKLPIISDVHFEQSPSRLKIVLPAKRNWPYLILYSVLAFLWLVMIIWGVVFIAQIVKSAANYRFVFAIMILILMFILFRFGRFLFRQWAQYLSNREVLFIDSEELIVRRPISIWGNTDVYDMNHVSPFYESTTPQALAFDYGYHHVYVGEGISTDARQSLRTYLNKVYFPGHIEE